MRHETVTVIIPVRNRPELLVDAVNSVRAQSYPAIEIILVDDGSTDETPAVIARLERMHPRVVRAARGPGRGPGPAREVGRRMARGAFLQYLDSDDRLLPGKFAAQVRALREHPEADIAYGISRLVDAEGRVLKEPFKWTGRRKAYLFPDLLVDRWWCTHTPLYRRSLCDRMGPWSDLRYSQDWAYDARAGALCARLAFVPEAVSEHRQHAGARQTGGAQWLEARDQVRFFGALFGGARKAGVAREAAEMQHFSRWVFAASRAAARAGDSDAARALYAIARMAARGAAVDLAAYRRLAAVAGWPRAARWLERFRGVRAPGRGTLRQSWMEPRE